MKSMLAAAAALAMFVAMPAPANAVVLVDDPNVPNCTLLGPNAADCEWVAVKIGTSILDRAGQKECPPYTVIVHRADEVGPDYCI